MEEEDEDGGAREEMEGAGLEVDEAVEELAGTVELGVGCEWLVCSVAAAD